MPRVRLGVALLVPPPIDVEVDGLRRALGDGGLGRIPAHLTLVPPVNVRTDQLGRALAVLRRAAAATRPFTLTLGPPATFLPDNPTLYLGVAGDVDQLRGLRDRVFVDPLARPLTWPFLPHVTLSDEASPGRIASGLEALADYRVDIRCGRVHLLREGPGRVWSPIADACFARPAVVGRGGLAVELTVTEEADPEAGALCRGLGLARLTVTARTDDGLAGYAEGWCGDGAAHVAVVVLAPGQAELGVGRHLLAAFRSEAAIRDCPDVTLAPLVGDVEDVG